MGESNIRVRPAGDDDRAAILELSPRLAEGVAPWRDQAEALLAGRRWLEESLDAANVSVKTVFTYVSAKEELLFRGQPTVLDAVILAVRGRRVGQTPLVAAAQALLAAVDEADEQVSLESFQRMVASGPAARSRVRALWDETETRLAEVLLAEARAAHGDLPAERAARRLTAAQIMVLVRTVTSDEVAELIAKSADTDAERREAFGQWIRDAAGRLARGLQSPAR